MEKKEFGLLILISLIFGILGFMAAYTANFLWWINLQQQEDKIYSHGITVVILYSIMILVLIFLAQRYIGERMSYRTK
ncbi:hypothetical protein HZA33_01520 [Candidatus Pacearchaeota archaeon]|nr:hypothetical protein [Candidatus Pacearchaeota archaeon]